MSNDLVGQSELARLLGVTPQCIAYWRKETDFPAPVINIPRKTRWSRPEVMAWMTRRSPLRKLHCRFKARKLPQVKRGQPRWIIWDRERHEKYAGPYVLKEDAERFAHDEENNLLATMND